MIVHPVQIHIDLAAMLGGLQRSLQRIIDLLSFGLLAAERATNGDLTLPGAYFHIATAGNARRSFTAARTEFCTWVLGNGLRECVESISLMLEEARSVCAYWSFGSKATVSVDEWNQRIVAEGKRFHRLGLPDKVNFLSKRYAPTLIPESIEQIFSLNSARNCLVHRGGIVSDRDQNSDDGLVVEWTKLELRAGEPGRERVLNPPADVAKGEVISIRQTRTRKLFQLGETVTSTHRILVKSAGPSLRSVNRWWQAPRPSAEQMALDSRTETQNLRRKRGQNLRTWHDSATQPPDPLPEFLVGRMRVHRRRQRRHVPGEPLGEIEIPRSPVHVGHRAVTLMPSSA